MEEAPSGSSVDGGLEGWAVNVENEMDEIQHYHNTIYIYICIGGYYVMHIYTMQEFVIYYFTLPNARLFYTV